MVKSNVKEEQRLGKQVRKIPCLYDKGNEDYKKGSRKKQIWITVKNASFRRTHFDFKGT